MTRSSGSNRPRSAKIPPSVPQIDLLTENTMCGVVALMPWPYHSIAIRPRRSTMNASVWVARSAWLRVVGLPSWPVKPMCPISSSDVLSGTERPEAAMLAVGISRRTLRKPQALNGAVRQFESVTSRSGPGGKSSIRPAVMLPPRFSCLAPGAGLREPPITFQRALNRPPESVDESIAGNRPLSGRKIATGGTKGLVAAPSRLRAITAPALPRSNQIEATLFDLMS
jgi:hypothetical protein